MKLSPLAFLFVIIILDLIPAAFFVTRIVARGRDFGMTPGWHVGLALFGGLIAGMMMNVATVQYILFRAQNMQPVPHAWQVAAVIGSGLFGSACAAGAVYWHLRLATQRDPDYGPMDGPPDAG